MIFIMRDGNPHGSLQKNDKISLMKDGELLTPGELEEIATNECIPRKGGQKPRRDTYSRFWLGGCLAGAAAGIITTIGVGNVYWFIAALFLLVLAIGELS